MSSNNRYLYILHFSDSLGFNYCKIGISKNVEQRRSQLQCYIDFELRIIYKKYLEGVFDFEKELKQRFWKKNVKYYVLGKQTPTKKILPNNTEWFHLSYKEVCDIKESLNQYSFVDKIKRKEIKGKGLGIEQSYNKTYTYKKQIKGKDYYQLSSIQFKHILQLIASKKIRVTERNFLKNICKRFQSNKMLTEKQYRYTKLLAYKYN